MTIIDLYAGPGGWDEGARSLGLTTVGYEMDAAACATRAAAGHPTIRQDVQTAWVPPHVGLIASPPCQAFSMAGNRKGEDDLGRIIRWVVACADGWVEDPTGPEPWADERSKHILQPLRWAWYGQPDWIALEQVPPCIDLWETLLVILQGWGYDGWTAVLNAADYGVPQTRKRAILAASRTATPHRPEVTHVDPRKGDSLFHQPWQSMADALGWAGAIDRRTNSKDGRGGMVPTVTVPSDRPAPGITGKAGGQWQLRMSNQENGTVRPVEQPAGTVFTGHRLNEIAWVRERPATSVCGDLRITDPTTVSARRNGDINPATGQPWRQFDQAVKVELWELAVLQVFDRNYPFQGTKTKQAEQIGNAVPPPLAAAVLSTVAALSEVPS